MAVYQINPLEDPRWAEFVGQHPRATVFHAPEWLQLLRVSYGYESLALTTDPPGSDLSNGIVFCRVKSWLTGSRLVSVPFADHCQPLFERVDDLNVVLEWISREAQKAGYRYVEIRPLINELPEFGERSRFGQAARFRIHMLDLEADLPEIFKSFNESSIQRRIRRAEREGLDYEEGSSPEMLKKFYGMQVLTRRRHGVPPQPMSWYRNLLAVFGDKATIHVASKQGVPIAGILTLRHGKSVTYKYGCSDEQYKNLAGTPLIFWKAIQKAKASAASTFDMGRSDVDNPGLIRFKANWGAKDLPLKYFRFPQPAAETMAGHSSVRAIGSYVVSHLPSSVLVGLGRVLYKHAA